MQKENTQEKNAMVQECVQLLSKLTDARKQEFYNLLVNLKANDTQAE